MQPTTSSSKVSAPSIPTSGGGAHKNVKSKAAATLQRAQARAHKARAKRERH
jgi:hypothetical protein